MDQLLPLVVRSNASPNSWLLLERLAGAFCWVLVTSFHGDSVVAGLSVVGSVEWLICRVSTACVIIIVSSSRGVPLLLFGVPKWGLVVEAQVVLFAPSVGVLWAMLVVGVSEARTSICGAVGRVLVL